MVDFFVYLKFLGDKGSKKHTLLPLYFLIYYMSTREEYPATCCKATREDLLESKKYNLDVLVDECPNCEKLGVLCFVSNHPPRAPVGD